MANSPSFEDKAVLEFFETSGRNLVAAEATAGVRHHIALPVVGTEPLHASRYFRAKMAQKNLIKASPVPFTIVRATHFFEFVGGIAPIGHRRANGSVVTCRCTAIVANDVAAALADVAVEEPVNGTVELAGPEPYVSTNSSDDS